MGIAPLLADVVVVLHLAYVAFVLLGGFLALRDLRWLAPHGAACGWGVVGMVAQAPCPLTALEKWLLTTGGEPSYDGPFISHYLAGTVYPVDAQGTVWQAAALIVMTSYVVAVAHHLPRHPDDSRLVLR